jgi:hypothetical protein
MKTVQAYDRPVLFADDVARKSHSPSRSRSSSRGHTSTPASPSSEHHHKPTRLHTGRQGFSTFEDFLPPHLIGTSPTYPAKKYSWSRAPSSTLEPPPSPFLKEKSEHSLSPEAVLPELPELPPSPPPKSFTDSVSPERSSEKRAHRAPAMRSTARIIERTLEAVLRGRRRDDERWVIV